MATKNFLFISKWPKSIAVVSYLFVIACQHGSPRDTGREVARPILPAVETPKGAVSNDSPPVAASPAQSPATRSSEPAPEAVAEVPKIGLILGPGSARALAHIGVVQELTKARLPISHIVGIEMGALVGVVYAQKAQAFDADWQLAKLKDLKSLTGFLQNTFSAAKISDLRLPFACPAYQLTKGQYLMMNKGVVTQMIPYCLSAPPTLKPFNQNIAAITELKSTADYLRSKGANFIVYVNVLTARNGVLTGGLEDDLNLFWTVTALALNKQAANVDFVLNVPVQEFDLTDWGHRREIIQKGLEAGLSGASQISKRLGL